MRKAKRKQVKVICSNCGVEFERDASEVKRNSEKNGNNYCSRRCCGIKNEKNIKNRIGGSERDEFSKFRRHIDIIKKREKKSSRFNDTDIDLPYLSYIWETQNGICPYSGVVLIPKYYGDKSRIEYWRLSSLDRINSSIGYIKGNVQFVSAAINNMKNLLSHKDTVELCKIIHNKCGGDAQKYKTISTYVLPSFYSRRDEYTGLRNFITKAKKRKRMGDISLEDILSVWKNQNGICVYSGVKLSLPPSTGTISIIFLASLDRIDSNKPYSIGNIQFVSAAMNYMKGLMSHEETECLCKLIALKWNNELK